MKQIIRRLLPVLGAVALAGVVVTGILHAPYLTGIGAAVIFAVAALVRWQQRRGSSASVAPMPTRSSTQDRLKGLGRRRPPQDSQVAGDTGADPGLRRRRPPRQPRMAGDTSTDPRGAVIGVVTGLVILLVLCAMVPIYSWVLNKAACSYWHVPRIIGHTSPWAITGMAAGTLLYLLGSVMNSWPGTREQRLDRRMPATLAWCVGFCLFVGGIGFAYRAITTPHNEAEKQIMAAAAQAMLKSQPPTPSQIPAQPTNAAKPASAK